MSMDIEVVVEGVAAWPRIGNVNVVSEVVVEGVAAWPRIGNANVVSEVDFSDEELIAVLIG